MANLVELRDERDFIQQAPIPSTKLRSADEKVTMKCKVEFSNWLAPRDRFEQHKAKVFGVILGQCTQAVNSELETDKDVYADLRMKRTAPGFLTILEKMSQLNTTTYEPLGAAQCVTRTFTLCHHPPKESVLTNTNKNRPNTRVVPAQTGLFYPSKLAKPKNDEDIAAFSERTLVEHHPQHAATIRYGSLKESLLISGIVKYPTTLPQVETLLTNFEDHSMRT